MKTRRLWKILGLAVGALVVMMSLLVMLIDEPLRRYLERTANERLEGYELRIGELAIHLFRGALELKDVRLRQVDRPEPPLASMDRWAASIHWLEMLSGRLVSEHHIEHPVLDVTRRQAKEEVPQTLDDTQGDEWQESVLALFPFTISEFVVDNGEVTYRDHPDKDAMHVSGLEIKILNIQNVRHEDQQYPSEISVHGQIFESGRFALDGRADFLAQPHLGIDCRIQVDELPADKLRPLAGRYNVQFQRGAVTAEGHVTYAPWVKEIRLLELLVDHMHVDYVHSARTAKKEKREGNHVAKKAKEIHRRADMLVKVGHAKVLNSEVGFVNQAASPDYRVFVDELNVELEDFSNRLEEGTAVVKVTGKFMGTGRTLVKGNFRPEKPDPDFDLDVQIVKTRLPSMNNVFRAYSDVDLKAGTFAFFSEMKVKDGHVDGYVKPFFKDVEVYDPEQDKNKVLMQKLFEAVVDGVMGILENVPTKEVATETNLEGPVENPRAHTWEVVINLVQNAFFKAILPGLERESKRT